MIGHDLAATKASSLDACNIVNTREGEGEGEGEGRELCLD